MQAYMFIVTHTHIHTQSLTLTHIYTFTHTHTYTTMHTHAHMNGVCSECVALVYARVRNTLHTHNTMARESPRTKNTHTTDAHTHITHLAVCSRVGVSCR
eukprot:GDKI01007574.1.p2 GENE.GDKI01007574.1~~GDKI01007574.1.p2  ORF type:complete len:100 (-),score=34.33 GDKI01007574.1:260-559(-)